jgi:hypothetical protein
MILITSGAFIGPEMQAELGRLPAAFVPLGNKRIYEHQCALLNGAFPGENIYLSLPDSFALSSPELLTIEKLGISVVSAPADISLGESLLFVINTIGRYDETMRILHGDTLIRHFPQESDVIALSTSSDVYPWEIESGHQAGDLVWCGYFAFSHIRSLARALSSCRGKFVDAVRVYRGEHAVHLAKVDGWHDLGHVNTYYRTRAAVTTQRVFNTLRIEHGIVRKTSNDHRKIEAEWYWYVQLPYALKRHTPQPIRYAVDGANRESGFYELEYLPCMPLNELFVHCNLSRAFWERIFLRIWQLMQLFETAVALTSAQRLDISRSHRELVLDKTRMRLKQFFATRPSDMHHQTRLNGQFLPSVADIVEECSDAALALPAMHGFSHGDLCLSNLLYDARSDAIKMLDPRGMDHAGVATSLGDLSYDYAKLVHSVVGFYDHIIAGRYVLTQEGPVAFRFELLLDDKAAAIGTQFCRDFQLNGISVDRIVPLTTLLFFSMLPLHADAPARQQALLANALRLYSQWKGP